MPTPTYDLIEEKVLGSAQATVTFSSIPGTYKDLVIEIPNYITTSAGASCYMRFNSDSGGNYSYTALNGNGTTASSNRGSNISWAYLALRLIGSSTTEPSTVFSQIMSYSNSNVYKTVISRSGLASAETNAIVSLWRNTNAITSLEVGGFTVNMASGTILRLWGVSG